MEVTEVLLPGVGIRYEFTTSRGARVGMIARRTGDAELLVYGSGDPDTPRHLLHLNRDESEAFAEMLGAPRVAERFADLTREVPGLVSGQIEIGERSPYRDRTLGDTRARTRTGASIVAIVRGDHVIASPTPAEELHTGDVLVVVGTDEGIAGVEHIVGAS
ncbi:cation:proton antiporter regulatory subunit [Streptomonospora wellingtoniae]|uniref:Cation:proton antiporter regulatory subunit n=1 Tax=Streptomonospora wellingtoniae TaxID=3075544 RepID=A0ABU2KUJ7_9ACTN|nr:cation:proton antiporter regulatory subunit [Streptomonospora sp. DSM 45055]MDT0302803.1 cation:proton antiporter regulatory subunit [Streptomonospora sp. DSM 45055]